MGCPVAIRIGNTEWPKWETRHEPRPGVREADAAADDVNAEKEVARNRPLTRPRPGPRRPGRACRSTASTTPARCSSGPARARPRPGWRSARWRRAFLEQAYGIRLVSHTVAIGTGGGRRRRRRCPTPTTSRRSTPTRCAPSTPTGSAAMVAEVEAAKRDGDTLGGVVEVLAYGLPPGLGSPRALGPAARLAARRRADGHPGDQGRRGRRRVPHRGPARLAGPRRDRARRRRHHPAPHRPGRRHRGRHVAPATCCACARR